MIIRIISINESFPWKILLFLPIPYNFNNVHIDVALIIILLVI